MRKTLREPALVLTLVVVVGLLGLFIIYPQLRVVLVPGLAGYVVRAGQVLVVSTLMLATNNSMTWCLSARLLVCSISWSHSRQLMSKVVASV